MEKDLNNLFIDIKTMNEIFDKATIVIDTNVLLMAYQWRDTTFKKVFDILEELSTSGRLKIPAQVLKEFANQRPQTIRDLANDLHNKILSKLDRGKSDHSNLDKVIPSLEFLHDKDQLMKSEKNYNDALSSLKEAQKAYKNTLNELLENIKEYLDNDPITEKFKTIFNESCLIDLNLNEKDLKEELEFRKKNNIPPGYRDKGHFGDMIIWSEILKLSSNHVIFITRDNKSDWVYKDSHGQVLGARRELVEEFYNSYKKTFKILTPLDFFEKYLEQKGENIGQTLKDDMKKNETSISSVLIDEYEKVKKSRLDFFSFNDLTSRNLKQIYFENYGKNIEEKLDLLGREQLISPEEYDELYDFYLEAKEFSIAEPNKAKEYFDLLDYKLRSILEEIFS